MLAIAKSQDKKKKIYIRVQRGINWTNCPAIKNTSIAVKKWILQDVLNPEQMDFHQLKGNTFHFRYWALSLQP